VKVLRIGKNAFQSRIIGAKILQQFSFCGKKLQKRLGSLPGIAEIAFGKEYFLYL
jgi:hypothetical protein